MCFTGDSAFWVGRTEHSAHSYDLRYWRLSGLKEFEYKGLPVSGELLHLAAVPGTSRIVVQDWSRLRSPFAYGHWSGDLAQPKVMVMEPFGTTGHCDGFVVGSGGRYYAMDHQQVLIHSVRKNGFHLDLTIPLPHCLSTPRLSLCVDARRFVVHCSESKLVCAVESGTGQVRGPWDWDIGQVNDAAIAPDGLTATAAGSSKKLAVWDLDD